MRRKSERAASKTTKAEASPEKKVDKPKLRTRRRKQSSSSEGSADESSPGHEEQMDVQTERKPASTPAKEDSPEEAQDQVWQVKTADAAKDSGEIHKLKICLTRPPSTPEKADRSPRIKRKLSRATSSSDSPSVEGGDDRRKSRRHRRRSARESKDEDIHQNSQLEEGQNETVEAQDKSESVVSQSTETKNETPLSTINEEDKLEGSEAGNESNQIAAATETALDPVANTKLTAGKGDSPDADTTVDSTKDDESNLEQSSSARERSQSFEKSEVLELHPDDTAEIADSLDQEEDRTSSRDNKRASRNKEVSIDGDKGNQNNSEEKVRNSKATNKTDVVDSSERVRRRSRNRSAEEGLDKNKRRDRFSTDSLKDADGDQIMKDLTESQEDPIHNGELPPPLVITRKRKWGSRKLTTQKSITISTDVLKEIIPDVKPVEFNEVIEERKERKEDKKHKKIEGGADKVMRPVLPKIVIDNSENVGKHKNDYEHDMVQHIKMEPLSHNRKISIVKENDSIITRPPSPPRHRQSDILFISNLTRPFTLPQLKNLLQRTGRIVENGFWIDKIKSKCYVQYENEDQAVETRHALHGVTWPVSNPKALQVDFSTPEAFEKARLHEDVNNAQASTIPVTVEAWMREQDEKRERGELEKPWERKLAAREWDMGKGIEIEIDSKDKIKKELDRHGYEKRRHRNEERSPEPEKKYKRKEEEAPAKLLDDLFRKTKTTPCIYWLPLSAETIAIKEEQRRKHMEEHERRLLELRRPATSHRRH